MFGKKKKVNRKFCPNCGAPLKPEDAYCIHCGYSFGQRQKGQEKKGVKWINLIIAIIIALLIYVGIRYANNQPIIPEFVKELFKFPIPKKNQ